MSPTCGGVHFLMEYLGERNKKPWRNNANRCTPPHVGGTAATLVEGKALQQVSGHVGFINLSIRPKTL
jgi:hypothetical protein